MKQKLKKQKQKYTSPQLPKLNILICVEFSQQQVNFSSKGNSLRGGEEGFLKSSSCYWPSLAWSCNTSGHSGVTRKVYGGRRPRGWGEKKGGAGNCLLCARHGWGKQSPEINPCRSWKVLGELGLPASKLPRALQPLCRVSFIPKGVFWIRSLERQDKE